MYYLYTGMAAQSGSSALAATSLRGLICLRSADF